ncbi:MAG TPA: DUF5686 family protein [Chitinophagaceae bacterium]|nr:DUF5686 family protein [Chitinophagaceae bacterium]
MRMIRNLLLAGFFLLAHCFTASAQEKVFKGVILDKQSDEPIPFASAVFKVNGRGALTDSLGRFLLYMQQWPAGDTLELSSVGYKIYDVPFTFSSSDTSIHVFHIEVLPPQHNATVKTKYNRALWFWRKIMAHKPINDRRKFNNFSYEIYNKLEVDIDKVNKEKLGKVKILKPFNFILDYVDSTSEKEPFLPVYLIETLSDYYYQKDPVRTREVIKAEITNGIDNESIMKQLGGTYQNVNVYDNTIPVFNKDFISPFNTNADNFYNFKLLDTQYLAKKRLVHFSFTARHAGQSTFEGDCWVHDTTFAIQKITLRPSLDANLNFITGMSIIQEYHLVQDSIWFLYKDKFVADFSPLGTKSHIAFKGRKTATYRNVVINDTSVTHELAKSKSPEDIVLLPNTGNLPDSFWQSHRHEPLNKDEQTVYKVLDTLEKNKTYIHTRNTINFITTGVKDIGNFRIGPWYNWISANYWEGARFRFDLSTNRNFSKHWFMHGYVAYGTKDNAVKEKGELEYEFGRTPWSYINLSYKHDLDNGALYTGQLGSDNLLAYLFRKNVPFKYQQVDEWKLDAYKENYHGFGIGLIADSRKFTPLLNLPDKALYPSVGSNDPLNTFETTLRLRYAYKEHVYHENFDRYSLGSDYPIVELRYTQGIKNVLNSGYNYSKASIIISDYLNIAPYGTLTYNLFAGKVFTKSALPYQALAIQPGNEFIYYSPYSFNLMNRFEYITDQYAGFNIEHNIGSGLFRLIPLTRKLKLRQLWEAKGVIGGLSEANRQFNFIGNYPFSNLNGKLYLEVGTGVDNIFKLFRVDFIWRVLPQPLPAAAVQRFGVFFGFRLSL